MRRLQLELPERLGLLHLLGAVDLLALLLAFLIVGGLNAGEVGAKIKLMNVGELIPVDQGVVVVTARGTASFPVISIGQEIVSMEEVASVLIAQKKEANVKNVYLSIEKTLPLTVQESLLMAINDALLDCVIIGEKRKATDRE